MFLIYENEIYTFLCVLELPATKICFIATKNQAFFVAQVAVELESLQFFGVNVARDMDKRCSWIFIESLLDSILWLLMNTKE